MCFVYLVTIDRTNNGLVVNLTCYTVKRCVRWFNSYFCDGGVSCISSAHMPSGGLTFNNPSHRSLRNYRWYLKVEEYGDEVFKKLSDGAHIYFCGLKGMMPGILNMLEKVATKKKMNWDNTLKDLKKKGKFFPCSSSYGRARQGFAYDRWRGLEGNCGLDGEMGDRSSPPCRRGRGALARHSCRWCKLLFQLPVWPSFFLCFVYIRNALSR